MEDEEKVNILLVDDDPRKLQALESILSGLGQNLVWARSGAEALRTLLRTEFAVVLLDVRMPGMDGFETAAMIRQHPRSEHLPIIFVTAADPSETHVSRGYLLGAVDYLYAPIVPDILRAKVAVFVELKLQRERLRRLQEREHSRQLGEAAERLENEVKRNRFITIAVDLLCIAGFDGFFRQLNPRWEPTLGFTLEELKAKRLLDLVHPDDREATGEELRKAESGQSIVHFENRCLARDGSIRWLLWNAAPYPKERLIYAVAHDITERKRAEAALERQTALLAAANQELEAFSYSVAHDLRAPLRSINGFSQAALEDFGDQMPPKAKDHLRRVCSAARRMGDLIDALLHLSRVGRAELRRQSFDLSKLARAIADEVAGDDTKRRVEVRIAEGLTAQADPQLAGVVLKNLFGNAWKFTAHKPDARIEFGAMLGLPAPAYFVRDNGAGFDMADADKLFVPFRRLHRETEFAGTGIGLATVRRIVARHGGRVWVEAAVGQGATFFFTLAGEGGGCGGRE